MIVSVVICKRSGRCYLVLALMISVGAGVRYAVVQKIRAGVSIAVIQNVRSRFISKKGVIYAALRN